MAAGTRTAGTVDGAGQYTKVSISFLAAGETKPRSESYLVSASASDAEIEAFVAAVQALTTASICRVGVEKVYTGAALLANATTTGRTSFEDKVVISALNIAVNNRRYVNIPAPDVALVPLDSEIPITGLTAFGTLITAYDDIKANYDADRVFFSERQETNTPVKL